MENLTQRWTQSRPFFQDQNIFFRAFSKKGKRKFHPSPLCCASVSVDEYASVPLNIPKYPWKCMNKLFWLCQGSQYAWASYLFDMPLKMPQVLNVSRVLNMVQLYMQGLHKDLNMPEYALRIHWRLSAILKTSNKSVWSNVFDM